MTDRKAHALLVNTKTRPLLPSKKISNDKALSTGDFLPLSTRKAKEDEQSYRSITKDDHDDSNTDMSESEAEDESSSDESTSPPLSARQEALRTIEQRLSTDSTSISDWLTLLEYSLADVPVMSKTTRNARSEIAASILSRALSASPGNTRSASLWLAYLRVGEDLWDEEKLRAEWEKSIKMAADPDIWMEWFGWRIRRASATLDDIKEDAVRVLRGIGAGLPNDDADQAMLRVFWRIAVFFRELGEHIGTRAIDCELMYPHQGFVETATALFQAQAEL